MSFTHTPNCPTCGYRMHISARDQYSCSNCGKRQGSNVSSSNSTYDDCLTTSAFLSSDTYDTGCSSDFGGGCSFD